MQFDWTFFACAVGLALALEGACYFIFAERMPKMLRMLAEQDPRALRFAGLAAMVVGVLIIYLFRR